jgi:hypothetical protein
MPKLITMLTGLIALLAAHPAIAQPECLQSFNVKKKTVVIDWLGAQGGKVMQCEAAEKLRAAIYLQNKAYFDQLGNGTPAVYVAAGDATVADLEKKIADLEKKIQTNETLSGLQIAAEVVIYEINKAAAIVSCMAPEPVVSKIFCAAALYSTASDTYKIMSGEITKNNFAEIAVRARSDLKTSKEQLAVVKAKLKSQDMPTVTKNLSAMFVGYCQAIRRDCL